MCGLELSENPLSVKDVMTERIIALSTLKTVMEAARLMEKMNVSSILVQSNTKFIGILTDRDIITRVVSKGLNPQHTNIASVMSTPLITISPEVSLEEAAETMRRHKVRRLVVQKTDRITGIITESDIVRVAPELHLLIREECKLHSVLQLQEVAESLTVGFCEECGNYTTNLRWCNGKHLCLDCSSERTM